MFLCFSPDFVDVYLPKCHNDKSNNLKSQCKCSQREETTQKGKHLFSSFFIQELFPFLSKGKGEEDKLTPSGWFVIGTSIRVKFMST